MHARHAPLLALLAALSATPLCAGDGPTPGAPGLGDPYYPTLGNGGYDALHYDLKLAIDVETGAVEGALARLPACPRGRPAARARGSGGAPGRR